MEGDFFMTKRQKFVDYYQDGVSLKNIGHLLGISYRTCKRWKQLYVENQLTIPHGLKGKIGNKTSSINHQAIMSEYLDSAKFLLEAPGKVAPYTFSYFVRYKLQAKCSLTTFKNIMKSNLIASPWARRETKKAYNKLLKAKIEHATNQEIKNQIKMIVDCNKKIYFRKPRPEYEGEIGEIDACKDYWIDNSYSHLHAVYDPATKKLKALYLGKEETTHNYYKVLEIMLNQGELPQLFKGDCRSSFVINKKDAGALAHKDVNTQFGFVLNTLGATMKNSSEATFKGGIERAFRTMQSQLKQEIRQRGCKSFDEVNAFLKEYCIQFNKQSGMQPIKKTKKFIDIKIPKSKFNELLSIRSYRKTDKGNSISYKNTLYSLYDEQGHRLAFKEKSAILVMETLNNKIMAKYFAKKVIMKPTQYQDLTRSQKDQYQNAIRLTPHFSAPDDHPWGYNVFMWHLHKTKNLNRYLKK